MQGEDLYNARRQPFLRKKTGHFQIGKTFVFNNAIIAGQIIAINPADIVFEGPWTFARICRASAFMQIQTNDVVDEHIDPTMSSVFLGFVSSAEDSLDQRILTQSGNTSQGIIMDAKGTQVEMDLGFGSVSSGFVLMRATVFTRIPKALTVPCNVEVIICMEGDVWQ